MVKYRPKQRSRHSRLLRKEEARSLRRAITFGFLTVILALALIFLGIPALIRMAIFLENLRSSSLPVETKDIFPPAPPQLKPLPEATNDAQVVVQGFAESGSAVEIFLNGKSTKKVIAENAGSFSTSSIKITSGRNEITAIATDKAGNSSQKSGKIIISYDEAPPELKISEPIDNAEFFGEENKITVKGKTEEKATVTVNERVVIVDSEGNFEYSLTLSEGENQILIVATDKAGNKTEKEIGLTYNP